MVVPEVSYIYGMTDIPQEVLGFCFKYNMTTDQFYGREVYPGDLFLDYLTTLIPGFNPKVGGSMHLYSVATLIPGFNPQVGVDLVLRSPQLLSLGDISTVEGTLFLYGCSSLRSLGHNLKSVGSLDLEGTPIYVIPKDLVARKKVWLDGPNTWIPTAEARGVLKEFKDSVKCSDDAGEVLLDRLNRPLWQVAYATDFLNGDIQV